MKLLVTGANGLVGSRAVKWLLGRGHRVVALGRGPSRLPASTGLEYRSVDLADAVGLSRAVTEAAPEVVLNFAGMTDVDGCERDRPAAWAANVSGVATFAQATTDVGAHLVHVSTDYIFDGHAGPYDVDAVANPRGVYASTKYAGELAVQTLARSWAIARTAVVFGWPAAGRSNFGSWLVGSLKDRKPVKLFEDQWVSPSLALNVAAMVGELGERKCSGVFHTAGAEVVDRVTFGRALCRRFGFDEALVTPSRMKDVPLAIPRPAKSGLVVTKTAELLTEKPLALSAALDRFFAEYQETP